MAYPTHPVTLPADLVGASNGKLTYQLVDVIFSGRGILKAHNQFARAWRALRDTCFSETGVVLTATSVADVYRTFTQQEIVFFQRYTTTPVAGTASIRQYQGKTWYLKLGYSQCATPGSSNHGLGLAIDMAEWRNLYIISIAASPAWQWLLSNVMSFGFSWEVQSEPWHIHLWSGDQPTQRVLNYENPPVPPPSPPTDYDDDMPTLYRDSRFWNVFLVNGDVTTVGPALNASLVARGVTQVVDTHDQSLISFMRKAQIKTGQLFPSSTPGVFDAPADLQGN